RHRVITHRLKQRLNSRFKLMDGYVDCHNGVWRIQGSLAVLGAIGDKHPARWVIVEPETKRIKTRLECEFLILAFDGIWDTVSNQEAVYILHPFCIGTKKADLTSEPLFKPIWMSKMPITSSSSLNSKKHTESRVLAANKQNTTSISLPTTNFQPESMSEM
nr:probable protein phosphatase 2C 25 [Tanacetum cinerariifolium]